MAFPGELNINYYKGDTYEFNVYPKLAGGSAMDLTDYTVTFRIAESRGVAYTAECYAIIPTDTDSSSFPNYIRCAIRPDDGNSLDASKTYVYDVEIRKASSPYSYVYTVLTGTISITDQVSITT
jgi:hypothetical protein